MEVKILFDLFGHNISLSQGGSQLKISERDLSQLNGQTVTVWMLRRCNIENCMVPVWYQHFPPITFETLFVHLTPDFLTYLQADKVVLPASLLPPQPPKQQSDSEEEEEEDDEEWDEAPTEAQPNFPDLEELVRQAIDRLGGEVFIKLNWGVSQAFIECSDGQYEVPRGGFTLALRRWENLTPSGPQTVGEPHEFRGVPLFVRNNSLLAVSQRHHRQYLPSVVQDRVNILNDMQQFFFNYLQGRFPDPDYVVDVYRAAPHRVILVDFNPFSRVTDPLLFTWSELNTLAPDTAPSLKVVEDEGLKGHPYSENRVPQEVVNVGNQQEINDFVRLFNNGRFTQQGDTDDEDL
eukprot:sb/3479612/